MPRGPISHRFRFDNAPIGRRRVLWAGSNSPFESTMNTSVDPARFSDNPPLVQVTRGGVVESQHRGAWVVTDCAGDILGGGGSYEDNFFARSTIKSLQILPLFESGATERFGVSDVEIALACASHNAEEIHTRPVAEFLERLGLATTDLRCGSQQPGDAQRRNAMRAAGEEPSALHNNCSGKHAGFLALAKHLQVPTADYLNPESEVQEAIRAAIAFMCNVDPEELVPAIDGCSAPTYRLSLRALALAFARVANPETLGGNRTAIYTRILDAVAAHPALIAGEHRRLCTALSRATGGRLFPKIGAEGVYVIGERGAGRALAIKLDDGGLRGLHPLVIELLKIQEFLTADEYASLSSWRSAELKNWAGLSVGTIEVVA